MMLVRPMITLGFIVNTFERGARVHGSDERSPQ